MKLIGIINIIFILNWTTCTKPSETNVYYYPKLIKERGLEKKYDEAKWLFYAGLLDMRTELRKKFKMSVKEDLSIIVKDTLCIALNFISHAEIDRDSNLMIVFNPVRHSIFLKKDTIDYQCQCLNMYAPEVFYYQKDSLVKIDCITNFFRGKDAKKVIDENLAKFPEILRKHKDQLNPWLKAEAQRRGIID